MRFIEHARTTESSLDQVIQRLAAVKEDRLADDDQQNARKIDVLITHAATLLISVQDSIHAVVKKSDTLTNSDRMDMMKLLDTVDTWLGKIVTQQWYQEVEAYG